MRFSMFLFYFILLYIFHPVFFLMFIRSFRQICVNCITIFILQNFNERETLEITGFTLDCKQIHFRQLFIAILHLLSLCCPKRIHDTHKLKRKGEREIKLRRIMQPNKKCHCEKCSTISIYDDVWKNSELIKQFRNKFSHRDVEVEYKDHSNSSINSHFIFMNTETFPTER